MRHFHRCSWIIALLAAPVLSAAADPVSDARAAYDQGHYAEALKTLDQLIATSNAPSEALELRLKVHLKLRQADKALSDYSRLSGRSQQDQKLLRELCLGIVGSYLGDMREQMRGAAVTALKEMGGADTLPLLEEALSDSSGLVRALAVEAIGREGHADRSVRLRKLLNDPAALVRAAGLRALAESGDRAAVPEIERALEDEQPRVRAAASAALVALGRPEALSVALEALRTPKPDERAAVLHILGHLKDERVVGPLLGGLSDQQPVVRATAAGILAERKEVKAVGGITALLTDPVPLVRGAAAMSLSKLQGPQAAGLLEPLLRRCSRIGRRPPNRLYALSCSPLIQASVQDSPTPWARLRVRRRFRFYLSYLGTPPLARASSRSGISRMSAQNNNWQS